jgi:hypothetical protein
MKARHAAIVLTMALAATPALQSEERRQRTRKVDVASAMARERALRRAQVWREPLVPIGSTRFGDNPSGSSTFPVNAVVPCRFKPGGISGNTPKFDCEIESGETLRVKYGRENAEVFAEVIATRLLSALGFATDQMYVIDRIHCFGCPENPFASLQCLNDGSTFEKCFAGVDYSRARDFEPVIIERQMAGRHIETRKDPGWTWEELTKIDPGAGGAPRAHVDALRLMAVFLSHWDNKSENQRLLCLDSSPTTNARTAAVKKTAKRDRAIDCRQPLAMIQDLGGTFGPFKLDLEGWQSTPIWAESATCRVSMRSLPYEGSTFPDVNISEPGRAFLAERLRQLRSTQVRDLFEGAGLARYAHKTDAAKNLDNWVEAFDEKVRAIVDHPGCPT